MIGDSSYDRMLQECLKGELRIVNAGLPQNRKSLSALLGEEYPHVKCSDSGVHSFKRKELEYIATLINADEQAALLLPILIELGANKAEAAVICQTGIEEKIISKILNMPAQPKNGKFTIYKPQLTLLRKVLKTTTQYMFTQKILK